MKAPNFFIVGAPKCGTSALYEYLKAHPGSFMPATSPRPPPAGEKPVWTQ